jgi:hypothetical protein
MTSDSLLELDELKAYFGEPFHLNSKITLYSPTVGDIIEFGEQRYYSVVHSLTCIPSDMKSQLFDSGIDYEEISDFELFCMLTRGLTQEDTKLLLGDLDLSKFEVCINTQNGLKLLYDRQNDIKIDELIYYKIVSYLRKLHNIKPKVEKAKNKTTKKILIELDRQRIEQKKKDKNITSTLKPLVSAMMRYPGFKYKSYELKQCSLYEFMDTVMGANVYVSSTALLKGIYGGMVDSSKVDKKQLDWMREI